MTGASEAKDFRASRDPKWQPYRDKDGNVVTITPDQCGAIFRALDIYAEVSKKEGRPTFDAQDVASRLAWINAKACLMGRILYDGKPPLIDAPPTACAAPDYRVEVPWGDDEPMADL